MTAPEVPDPPAEMLMWVDPEWIRQQRDQGWPDMHPEDYCHRCGARNASWYAEREDWLAATSAWAAETGHEGICCPTCFIEMHREQAGEKICWLITRAQSPEDRAVLDVVDEWAASGLESIWKMRAFNAARARRASRGGA